MKTCVQVPKSGTWTHHEEPTVIVYIEIDRKQNMQNLIQK